jgi:hypothetical protein
MITRARCPNPVCGHATRMGHDPLGRVFRCPRCQSKLSNDSGLDRSASGPAGSSGRHLLAQAGSVGVKKRPAWGCDDSGQWPERYRDDRDERATEIDDDSSVFSVAEIAAGEPSFSSLSTLGVRPDARPRAKSRVGRYEIECTIGEGQYAVVYRGYDPILGRSVALKRPRPGVIPVAKMKERFLGEARALARLKHPAIIPVFELGDDDGECFIAMALVEGKSLEQIREQQPSTIGVGRAARIVADLADALDHVHARGIRHRDVKPANVLIDDMGAVYLSDFGIACGTDADDFAHTPGTLLGTPAYTAPEQASGEQATILPASDQYSLGVLFYELLCGRTPFTGPPLYVLFQAMNQKVVSPREIRPSVPAALADICSRTLSRLPEDRYRSCRDLAWHLRAWLGRAGNACGDIRRVR